MEESTETAATGNPHTVEGRRGSSWRGWVLSILVAILLWLCALAIGTVARAEETHRPVNYYVDAALANNPSLASMKARIAAKENEAVRAGALADPKAWIGLVNVPTNTWSLNEEDMTGKEVGISQMLPFPGKRDNSTRIVVQEKEQAEFELAEMRNVLRADVKMAYAELSTVRAQTEVVRQVRAILEQIVEVSREMFAVGKGSQADVLRGQVEFQKMRELLLTLENRQRVLSVRLNTLAALPPEEPVLPLDSLAEFRTNFSADQLRRIYLEDRPARKSIQAKIRKGDLLVAQAEYEGKPEFEVSASYMQRDKAPDGMKRSDMVSAMVSMTLPVWRKGKVDPGIRAMAAEKEMAVRDQETLDNETANGIGSGLSSLGNFGSVATLYRTTLIPQAEQSEQSNLEAYRVGKIDFPMLMDSVTTVLNFRKEYLGMVGEMHTTKARLEAAVGRELDGAAPNSGEMAPPNAKNSNGEGR
ncbi:TolC family protein [Candidatus Deferrimicrobium sp.]|uniref:TolC family protein n=1 Tax=Candidatus Deferrimicrobium sp. TaxID=3060586 RepID=UPI003C38DEAB